jgi:hypothetical protein
LETWKVSGVSWQSGGVDFKGGKVYYFENAGVVWYDAKNGIALSGWQEALEPYEGPGLEGFPLSDT